MHSSAVAGVSDEWLRTFVYEQGKEGGTDVGSASDLLVRLAEARAAIRRASRATRRMVADAERETATVAFEDEREDA
jgi:hypothetical protein